MNRYRLENFEENVNRLRRYLDANQGIKLCAVFDVGTKATKLLVGPKSPPMTSQTWRKGAFFNDGQLFALGSDHFEGGRAELNIRESGALEGVVFFVEAYRTILQAGGVALEDMHAFGTAVFRWMKNREEVVDHIRIRAKFGMRVLDPDDEAFFSCLAIERTYAFGTGRDHQPLGEDDVILLFDQGGGSTEVSYFKPGNRSVGAHDSLHYFGTVALQEMFFNLHDGTKRGDRPDPAENRNRISTQFDRVNKHLAQRVKEWSGFPGLKSGRSTLHAYGMGTALSKLLGSGGNFDHHNRVVSVDSMDATLAKYCQKLDTSNQQVRTLYKAFKDEESHGGKEISRLLVLLYGLPVYRQLLSKFGLDHLRFAGYGLRYGAYLAVCGGMKWDDLGKAKPKDKSHDLFLSYSSKDKNLAIRISKDLKEKGIGVWFAEHQIDIGDPFPGKIDEGLQSSRSLAVVLSKASVSSYWVNKEVQAAQATKMHILPIKTEECDIPPLLAPLHFADFTGEYEPAFNKLLESLQRPPQD